MNIFPTSKLLWKLFLQKGPRVPPEVQGTELCMPWIVSAINPLAQMIIPMKGSSLQYEKVSMSLLLLSGNTTPDWSARNLLAFHLCSGHKIDSPSFMLQNFPLKENQQQEASSGSQQHGPSSERSAVSRNTAAEIKQRLPCLPASVQLGQESSSLQLD